MTFNPVNAIFNQIDANQDGSISQNEFSSWIGGAAGAGGSSGYYSSYGGAGYGGSVYEGSYGAGYGDAAVYESAAYGSGAVYDNSASYAAAAVQHYPTDAQGLYIDSNPQIIRRPAAGGLQTYTQNIRVRFLQPPPLPPPGPLIIKEVRPPQPPPPPPLRIRQQAPQLPQPPPLVLRERPPHAPAPIASQTVIRRLAALPVPPRSVIIERLPPLPPRPRDVIIERWLPYGAQGKRRVIVQRAGPAPQYAQPRNVIIQYEPVQVNVVRQFQNLGVTQASPSAYVQQYGGSLLDGASLVSHARAHGVVEDLSLHGHAGAAIGYSSGVYGQDFGYSASSFEGLGGGYGYVSGGAYDAGYDLGYGGSSLYETSGWSSGGGYTYDSGYY